MKITKKDFINAMTSNLSHFMGTTRTLLSKDELYCKIDYLAGDTTFLNWRDCKARSNDLVFTGDNHMMFETGMSFHRYDYPMGKVYVAVKDWVQMYYFIKL